MASWDDDPEDLVAFRDEWIEAYGVAWGRDAGDDIISIDELTDENYARLKELDEKHLVWTNHSTCEDDYFTPGFHVFGDCQYLEQESRGCGCWQTHAWYIAKEPWEDENERIDATAYLPCSVCNPDGEGEGVEGCEGPEIPEGADRDECMDGHVHWYFD